MVSTIMLAIFCLFCFVLASPRGLWDLSSPTGMQPRPSAVKARSPSEHQGIPYAW